MFDSRNQQAPDNTKTEPVAARTTEYCLREFSEQINNWFESESKRAPKGAAEILDAIKNSGFVKHPSSFCDILSELLPKLRDDFAKAGGSKPATITIPELFQILFSSANYGDVLRVVWNQSLELKLRKRVVSISVLQENLIGVENTGEGDNVSKIAALPGAPEYLTDEEVKARLTEQNTRTVILAVPQAGVVNIYNSETKKYEPAPLDRDYQLFEIGGGSFNEKLNNAERLLKELFPTGTILGNQISIPLRLPDTKISGQTQLCRSGIKGSFPVSRLRDIGNHLSEPPDGEKWSAFQSAQYPNLNETASYLLVGDVPRKVAYFEAPRIWGDIRWAAAKELYKHDYSIIPGNDSFLEVIPAGATPPVLGEGWRTIQVPGTPGYQRYSPAERAAREYYSSLTADQDKQYRDILTALQQVGRVSKNLDLSVVKLQEILSYGKHRVGPKISDITEGPGVYKSVDEDLQYYLTNNPELGAIKDSEICCLWDDRVGLQGTLSLLRFTRTSDGKLELSRETILAMS